MGSPNPESLRDVIEEAKKMGDDSLELIVAVMKAMNGGAHR